MIEVTGNLPAVETLGNVTPAQLAAASGQTQYVFNTTAATDQASLQALADAYLMKLALAKVKGSIELPGSAAVLPGSLGNLSRVGNHFSGKVFVPEVTHTMGPTGKRSSASAWTSSGLRSATPTWPRP